MKILTLKQCWNCWENFSGCTFIFPLCNPSTSEQKIGKLVQITPPPPPHLFNCPTIRFVSIESCSHMLKTCQFPDLKQQNVSILRPPPPSIPQFALPYRSKSMLYPYSVVTFKAAAQLPQWFEIAAWTQRANDLQAINQLVPVSLRHRLRWKLRRFAKPVVKPFRLLDLTSQPLSQDNIFAFQTWPNFAVSHFAFRGIGTP